MCVASQLHRSAERQSNTLWFPRTTMVVHATSWSFIKEGADRTQSKKPTWRLQWFMDVLNFLLIVMVVVWKFLKIRSIITCYGWVVFWMGHCDWYVTKQIHILLAFHRSINRSISVTNPLWNRILRKWPTSTITVARCSAHLDNAVRRIHRNPNEYL